MSDYYRYNRYFTTGLRRISRLPGGLAAIILLIPELAVAQSGTMLEEVVVTAQKREESLQQVPIAISAFGGDQIKDLAIGDLRELIEFVPGVELFDDRGISSQPTWIIRGVGLADFNANNTPTAAIYYDEFYLTSNVMGGIGMFDIGRIEVLKGAQGGLYGRNTTGGAIRVQSRRPSLEGPDGYITGSYGRYDAYGVEAAFGAPLGDKAAFRLSGMTSQGGGYQDSLVTPQDDDFGDRDFWALRGQLLFEPSDTVSILLKVDTGKDRSETLLGHSVGAYDPFTGNNCAAVLSGRQDNQSCINWATFTTLVLTGAPGGPLASRQSGDGKVVVANPINQLDNKWTSALGQIDVDLSAATLTSITGYIDYENRQAFDFDGGPLITGHEFNTSPIKAWSQELRLISNDDGGALSWLAGAMYAEDELNEARNFVVSDNVLIFGGLTDSDRGFDQKTESWAVYAQLGYRMSEAWKVHGSLRYTDEHKNLTNGFTALNIAPGVPIDFPLGPGSARQTELDENWSGHLGIDWTPADGKLIYAKISRGVKSGGFFGGFSLSEPELDPYREETVWSYEVGFKSDLMDRTLRLNGAVYYYDYSDVQGFTSVFSDITGTAVTKLGNIGDAKHYGAELDFIWLPGVEGLTFSGGFSWLDAELSSDTTFLAEDFLTEVPRDGLKRGFAPKFSYSLNAAYQRPIFNNLLGEIQLGYSWRDDLVNIDTTGIAINSALFGIKSYGLLNARLQLSSPESGWKVALIGKNLTDEKYIANQTTDNLGSYLNTYGRPFSWAIEAMYNWQ